MSARVERVEGGRRARGRALGWLGLALCVPALTGCLYALPALFVGGGGRRGVVVLRAEGADLLVSRGNQDAGDSTEGRGATIVAAQLRLAATKATTLRGLTVSASGTGDDGAVGLVRLHRDADADGLLDPADPQLGATTRFSGDEGAAGFPGLSLALAAGGVADLLVVLETPTAARDGETFRVGLASADAVEASVLEGGEERLVGVFGVPLQGGTKTISAAGSLTLRLGPAPPPDAAVLANAQDVGLLQLELRASSAEPVGVNQLRLRTSGSGQDAADVARAELFLDADGDGRLDLATDRLIVAAPPAATDDGVLALDGLAQTLQAGASARWLLVYDLQGTAADGATLRVDLLAAADVAAQGVTSQQALAPVVVGPPVPGATVTARRARLTFAAGPESPGPSAVVAGAVGVPVLQLLATAGTGEDVLLQALTLRASGTANDPAAVQQARLLLEGPGPRGVADGTDVQLGAGQAFAADDGALTFAIAPPALLAAGTSARLLLVYDVAPAAAPGTIAARLDAAGDVAATGGASGLAGQALGAPVAGAAKTIQAAGPLPAVTVTQTALAPAGVTAGQAGVVALELQLAETSGNDAAVLRSLSVRADPAGTADDAAGVAAVELYRDGAPFGGAAGPEDAALGLAAYFADGGTCVFAGLAETVPALGTLRLLVVYDLASPLTPGQTFVARLEPAAAEVEAQAGGQPVAPGGLPLSGRTLTVQGSLLTVRQGAASPGGSLDARGGTTSLVLVQLELQANPVQAVTVTALEVQAAGTADDAAGVAALVLYEDVAGDGDRDPGADPELARLASPYAVDDGAAQLTGLRRVVPAGATVRWLLAYDLAAAVPAGGTFAASVLDAARVTVAAPSAVVDGGLPATGRSLRAVGGVTASVGPQSPAGRTLGTPEADAAVLQLRLAADPAEVMTVSALTFTASGSADDVASFPAVRLRRDDGDGVFELTDAALGGVTAFAADDGTVTFAGLSEAIPAGGAIDVWLSADVAGAPPATAGATFRACLALEAHVSATGGTTGSTLASGGGATGSAFQTGAPASLFSLVVGRERDVVSGPAVTIRDLVPADYDRDGALDYALLRGDDRVEVRRGDGTGLFASHDLAAVTDPRRARAGDVDGDGWPDLVVLHDGGGGAVDSVSVLLNDGAGRFGAPSDTETIAGGDLRDLALGDYDRDGALDVVVLDAAGQQLVGRRGDGAGLVDLANALGLGAGPRRLDLADVDRDGRLDALFTDAGDALQLAPGDGVFFAPPSADAAGNTPRDLVTLDLDRDGFEDALVVAEGGQEYRSLRSAGGAAPDLTAAANGDTSPAPLAADNPRDLVAGDWDGDGRADAAIVHQGVDGVVARRSDGTAALPAGGAASEHPTPDVPDPDRIAAGDWDGDGDPDLLVATSLAADQDVQLLLGDGQTGGGRASLAAPSLHPWAHGPRGVAVADFDRDGALDYALCSRPDARAAVFLNGGGGASFTLAAELATSAPPAAVLAADVTRDGRADLVVLARDRLELFPGNGDGTFGLPSTAFAVDASDPEALALGDLDLDGLVDAVAAETGASRLQVFRGTAAGLANAGALDRYPTSATPVDVALADLDRDGELDAAVLCLAGGPGQVEVFRGLPGGSGLSAPPVVTALAAALGTPRALAAGDLDRDGRLDLVVVSADQPLVQVLAGLGTGAFAPQAPAASVAARDVALGDTDRDGRVDVVGCAGAGGAFVQRSTGGLSLGAAALRATAAGTASRALVLEDVDGDGDLDAVVAVEDASSAQVFRGE